MVTALGLGLVAAGLVLATAGVTDRPVLDVVKGRLTGSTSGGGGGGKGQGPVLPRPSTGPPKLWGGTFTR